MTSNLQWFVESSFAAIATYWLHSTLLIGLVWLGDVVLRQDSLSLRESLWKWAATIPLLSVPAQLALTDHQPWLALTVTSVESLEPATDPTTRSGLADRQPFRTAQDRSRIDGRMHGAHSSRLRPPAPTSGDGESDGGADSAGIVQRVGEGWTIRIRPGDGRTEIQRIPTVDAAVPSPMVMHHSDIDTASSANSLRRDDRAHSAGPNATGSEHQPLVAVIPGRDTYGAEVKPAPAATAVNVTRPERRQPLTAVAQIIVGVVLVTVAGGGLRLLVVAIRTRRFLRSSTPVTDGPNLRALNGLIERHNVRRRIRLISSTSCHEPGVHGVWRWTIVLPAGIEQQLDKQQLRALLAHELAHLVRGDTRWLWVGRFLSCCLPIQPLNLLAVKRWRDLSEFLCDDWAVGQGIHSIVLSRSLTRVAEWRLEGPAALIALNAGGSAGRLTDRVERLMTRPPTDNWQTRRRRTVIAAAIASVVVASVLGGPRVVWSRSASGTEVTTEPGGSPAAGRLMHEPVRTTESAEADELAVVADDLDRAMELLAATENNSSVVELVDRIRRRLRQLRERTNVSGAETNGFVDRDPDTGNTTPNQDAGG